LEQIHWEAALSLFYHLHFDESLSHFLQSKADIRKIIDFYPGMLPSESSYYSEKSSMNNSTVSSLSIIENRPISIDTLVSELSSDDQAILENVRKAKMFLLKLLLSYHIDLSKEMIVKDVQSVLIGLYLDLSEAEIGQIMSELNISTPSSEPSFMIENLLKSNTLFHYRSLESMLKQRQCYVLLGLLYKNEKRYKEALEIWAKLGSGEKVDSLSKGSDNGVRATVQLLSEIDVRESYDNLQYIWKYGKWVLEKDFQEGMKIFTLKRRPTELEPKQVLSYLQAFGPSAVQAYFEFLLYQCGNENSEYHTRLALSYIESIGNSFTKKRLSVTNLSSSLSIDLFTNESGTFGEIQKKLQTLLQVSNRYDGETLLAHIVQLPLYEEQVLLYTKLRKYSEALLVIVEKLNNNSRAEQYCTDHFEQDKKITFSLLQIYMSQNLQKEDQYIPKNAWNLLCTRANELNPYDVIPLLPPEMPISLLSDYFRKSIHFFQHKWRTKQIVKNICKAEDRTLRYKLAILMKRSVVITRDRVCPVCQKRIENVVFVCYPNGTVIHMKCVTSLSICPLTGEDFTKSDYAIAMDD